jgi:hypothetical protein
LEERALIGVFMSMDVLEAGWDGMASSCVLRKKKIRWIDNNNVMNNYKEKMQLRNDVFEGWANEKKI